MLQQEFDTHSDVKKYANKEVLAFSDCIIISIASESDHAQLQGTYDTWLQELAIIAFSQYHCVLKGYFIRGGLSDGWWYHDKQNVIISPALVESVKIEKESTHWPIIALSDSLAAYFADEENQKDYSYDPTKDLLLKGNDYCYIDYLGFSIENLDWMANDKIVHKYRQTETDARGKVMTEGWKLNAEAALSRHRQVVVTSYASEDAAKVKEKYEWLANYHNSVIDRYGNVFGKLKIQNLKAISAK